jgi:hypothetical protein
VKVRHLVLFAAKAFTSAQLYFSGFRSFSTVRCSRASFFPGSLRIAFQAAFVISLGPFLSACPIHVHFFFLLFLLIWVSAHRSYSEIAFGHLLLIIIRIYITHYSPELNNNLP